MFDLQGPAFKLNCKGLAEELDEQRRAGLNAIACVQQSGLLGLTHWAWQVQRAPFSDVTLRKIRSDAIACHTLRHSFVCWLYQSPCHARILKIPLLQVYAHEALFPHQATARSSYYSIRALQPEKRGIPCSILTQPTSAVLEPAFLTC